MPQPNTQGLVKLSDAGDLRVADGNDDVRGWEVRTQNGEKVGKVKDLLIDPTALRARYLDVEAGGGIFGGGRRVLVPVGMARLADDDDLVLLQVDASQLAMPEYDGSTVTRDYESSLRSHLAGGSAAGTGAASTSKRGSNDTQDFYADQHFQEQGLYGSRRGQRSLGNEGEARVTRSEEELSVGKRRVQAGEAYVHKHVETEHVRQSVPVMHEEVTVERRPISAGSGTQATITDDEIRVPLMAEEVVSEKRVVGKEEVVIRKHAVQGEQTVEADLRRERVDVDDAQARTGGQRHASDVGGKVDRTTDRFADKLDDVKDRVDGNPASRPGRDATDRPTR